MNTDQMSIHTKSEQVPFRPVNIGGTCFGVMTSIFSKNILGHIKKYLH